MLQDAASGKSHRFTPIAYYFIHSLDGQLSIESIWSEMAETFGNDAPSQDEVIRLLTQLHSADLLRLDTQPDALELFDRFSRQNQSVLKRNLKSPLSITLPLWDPDLFLKRMLPLFRPLFSRIGLAVWLLAVAPAIYLAVLHAQELSGNLSDRVFAAEGLLLIALVYLIVKLLHELGHGLATRAFGGEVHQLGLMFLVFFPVPYVDASASAGFRSKYQRAAVAGAGIMVETFLAACGLYLWLSVEAGPVRAVAFDVMLVSGLSTILVNGNPLLKFDGYFVLIDLIEMPNMAPRSSKYWASLIERRVFGVEKKGDILSFGEHVWLLLFGPASYIYRMTVLFGISLFVATHYLFFGVLLALWGLLSGIAAPVGKMLWHVVASPQLRRHRTRAIGITALAFIGFAGPLFFVPLPLNTMSQGMIWLPEDAYVRAGADGFLQKISHDAGSYVEKGETLFESADPDLAIQLLILEARVRELDIRFRSERLSDRSQAEVTSKELEEVSAELERARDRSRHLIAHSASAGKLVLDRGNDLFQRFFHKGDVLGYVTPPTGKTIRVVVSQDDIDLVRNRLVRVTVRLPGQADTSLPAKILHEVPSALDHLPSKALASSNGGSIPTDPRDAEGVKSLKRWFQIDLDISGNPVPPSFGSRVYVRFEHQWEPAAAQIGRRVRQLFLAQFHA